MGDNFEDLGSRFAAVAAQYGDSPALRLDSGDVSYGDLLARAERIATWLLGQKVARGATVALQNGKSLDGYAAMLACLRLGAAYVNLDGQNPPERLTHILGACRPALILSDGVVAPSIAAAAERLSIPVASLPERAHEIDASTPSHDWPAAAPDDVAYIMFTSGSTGVPKGAAIAQASVANFIDWIQRRFDIGATDVVANANPIYFDNSVFDVYAALFSGACLVPFSVETLADARATVRRVDETGCTIWFSVPTLLIYLATMKALKAESFRRVRRIVFGGEGYPKSELRKLFELYGARARLVNVYGPTECTCICSAHDVTAEDLRDETGLPPLGRIAEPFGYAILDGDRAADPGEVGELCLMGPQLALGYCNDPVQTAAAFVLSPRTQGAPERMYRTGDLVREAAGLLHFVGRKDNQIKHMGYRIELEEIEAAINGLANVTQAAVTYRRVHAGFGHIVAFVATSDAAATPERLRAELADHLPPYMIPNRFVLCKALPKNANGKVDRARLATM
jgi:D-alanine--poly(phosphoribitol) ligase subunit 1